MSFFISDAYAQAGAGQGGGLLSLLPLVVIFVIFYFLLIRPQQKRAKQHKEMVQAIKKGDDVVTNGGLLGKIVDTDDNFVTVDIAKGVEVKVQRHAIAQMMPKGTSKTD
jgi:preprotein translocase subunit YajC